jgi:lysozyme
MNISQNGINLIKAFEEFESCPYHDQIGVPTIGYGTTYYPNGPKVTMNDTCIDEATATSYLVSYLAPVEAKISKIVTQPINQNQFDSLCSFSYNLGIGALEESTLLKEINVDPSNPDITHQFSLWCHAGGVVLSDLVKRRAKEAALYFTPVS